MNTKRFIVVQEDTNLYNIFDTECDFDEDGWYADHQEEDGYHITDFADDIVFETDSFELADEWINKKLGYEV